MDSGQGNDLAPIFENLSHSEKLSKIKPPLGHFPFCAASISYLIANPPLFGTKPLASLLSLHLFDSTQL